MAQLRRSVHRQKDRVRAALVVSGLLASGLVAAFTLSWPLFHRILLGVLLAFSLFAALADHRLRLAKEAELSRAERGG